MFSSLSYLIMAIISLSFLIFIHELGHYWMARRVGMRVETFSIGFGRPIISWVRDGVTWQIGWLLFGGFVRIAGTDTDKDSDPYTVPDGFFGKSPLDRIKVSAAGPLANLFLALLFFSLIWLTGGREKSLTEFTSRIGWVDPKSELYTDGVRPGDAVMSYDKHPFQGYKDHLYAPMMAEGPVEVQGLKINYDTGDKTPFDLTVKPYQHPAKILEKGLLTLGILQPASYIIYNRLPNGSENPLPEGSPLQGSGIQYGDRVYWVDGERIFSVQQLTQVLNDGRALLTVKRGDKTFLARVPRVEVQEFKLDPEFKEELVDWQYEAQLNGAKIQKLYAIPYDINNFGIIQSQLKFIDKDRQEETFNPHPFSSLEDTLKTGDQIIAVDGTPVEHAYQIFYQLQRRRVHIVVERNEELLKPIPMVDADKDFDVSNSGVALNKIVSTIGTKTPVTHSDDLFLLNPVIPITRGELIQRQDQRSLLADDLQGQLQKAKEIEDPERRSQAIQMIEAREKQLMLGLPMIQDRSVHYNPNPLALFQQVYEEIWRTLSALVTGSLNPKWMSGPVGIVQVVHNQWMLGFSEAMYWLGAISLNLGILNLLPIPMLDGGSIMFSLFELITRRKIDPKTMEKVIIPFAVLLILFFIFLTFNDVSRIFGGYFK